MKTCTFFGHRECPDSIAISLHEVLLHLIVSEGVELFYVGNQGKFDALVHRQLKNLALQFPNLRYAVVLAYLPTKQQGMNFPDTMFPEGLESVHPRFAIDWRNRWMLAQSDVVVTYVTHTWGGAARYVQQAYRQGKTVVNLAERGL